MGPRDDDFTKQSIVDPVRSFRTNGGYGQIVHKEHDDSKNRQGQEPVGDNPVNLVGGGELAAALFDVAVGNNGRNVFVAFVGDDAFGIVVHFLFHGLNVAVDMVEDILGQFQSRPYLVIPFEEFNGIPAFLVLGQQSLGGFFDMGQGVFHRAVKAVAGSEVVLMLGRLGSQVSSFLDAFPGPSRNAYHRAAHFLGQLVQVYDVVVFPYHVDHIHRHDYGNAQFRQLGAQVQVPFQVGAVHNVQNGIGPLLHQVIPGYHFFQSVGRERVDTGQILNDHVRMAAELAFFFLYRNAGPVAHKLVGPGEGVE